MLANIKAFHCLECFISSTLSLLFQEEELALTPQEPTPSSELPPGPVLNGGLTPKHQWRGLLPSMASTPDHRGMSRLVGKPTMWFPNRSDTNQAVQAQKMARDWKFWI